MARKRYSWDLPKEIEERLGENSYGRQRAIFEVDHLLLILHQVPGEEDMIRESIVFLRTPDGKWQCNGRDTGVQKLKNLLAEYVAAYQKYDALYDNAQSAKELFGVIEPVTPIHRAAAHMAEAIQAARGYVKGDQMLIGIRDEAQEISRSFELLLSDAKLSLDYRMAKNAERQARQGHEMAEAQHKLNLLAAVTFPLMALSAIFGMNLIHGFENRTPVLFWVVMIVGIIIGMATQKWVTKVQELESARKGKKRR